MQLFVCACVLHHITLHITASEAERSAAAMDVHVGHFSDPPELPGLAHFCEHMLFLGVYVCVNVSVCLCMLMNVCVCVNVCV